MRLETLQKKAIRTGQRQARRKGQALSLGELEAMKIQVLPTWVRVFLGLLGLALVVIGFVQSEAGLLFQALLIGSGIVLLVSSAWGVRRSFSKLCDGVDGAHLIDGVCGIIGAVFD